MLLPVRSGFCSLPESANSFSMIFWVSTNQLWSWPVRAQVLERAEGVEAGEQRHGQPLAGRVEPQARRAGQDPDAVLRPHRRVVGDALDVVPHPVAVDEVGAGLLGDAEHAPVDVRGHAGEHRLRARCRAARATARAPGRGCRRCRRSRRSTRRRLELEVAGHVRDCSARRARPRRRRRTAPRAPDDRAASRRQLVDPVAELQLDQPGLDARRARP